MVCAIRRQGGENNAVVGGHHGDDARFSLEFEFYPDTGHIPLTIP